MKSTGTADPSARAAIEENSHATGGQKKGNPINPTKPGTQVPEDVQKENLRDGIKIFRNVDLEEHIGPFIPEQEPHP